MKHNSALSVWAKPEGKKRNRSPLDRESIVRAAVELLDADGSAGLSVRRLADRLGAGQNSVYWYVASRDDLVELAVNAVLAEIPLDPAVDDWQAEAKRLATGLHEVLVRHPWATPALSASVLLGPSFLAFADRVLRAFRAAGFAGEELDGALNALFNYVVGSALVAVASVATAQRHELDELAWADMLREYASGLGDGHAEVAAYLARSSFGTAQDRFEHGLDRVLRGLLP